MNDEDIARVLQAAAPRVRPPAEMENSVRGRLRGVWLELVAERRARRRRGIGLALAAGLATATLAVWLAAPEIIAPSPEVATLARATGDVRVESGWFSGPEAVGPGAALRAGQTLATGANGRVAIVLAGGPSARLDHSTRIALEAPDRLVIEQGALYVDTGDGPRSAARLAIVTPAGVLRHVGTQYEVRRLPAGVRVRVREGRVEWTPTRGAAAVGVAGEQLTIAGDGAIQRSSVAGHGASWDWVASTTPGIDIEGLTLAQFLDWAGRELGCAIDFATPDIAVEATGIVLHGSIAHLTPEQAIETVFATTRLRGDVGDGRIAVTPRG